MFSIDRHLVIVKPKVPFLQWLRQVNSEDERLTLEDIREDSTTFMIPAFEMPEEDEKFIKGIFPDIFEMELEEWYLDTELWPANRTYKLFREWFDIEVHSVIIDTLDMQIEKETFYS